MKKTNLTLADIVKNEQEMVANGSKNYGLYFVNAAEFNMLLNNFIESILEEDKYISLAFFSQLKKHHTLALLSAIRLHHVQTGMNLRQVCEAGAWIPYAMAHADINKFCLKDKNGIIQIPQRLETKRNKWLLKNFPTSSENFRKIKDNINASVAHSNIVNTSNNFLSKNEDNLGFDLLFFDVEDEYVVKNDLFWIANIAMGLLDLFFGVNQKYKTFKFVDDFQSKYKKLVCDNQKLKKELMNHPRYLKVIKHEI